MKSSRGELKNRGYVWEEDFLEYQDCTYSQLMQLLRSTIANRRSIAIILLLNQYGLTKENTILFLNQLKKEKALYTKITLTEALEKGDKETVAEMIPFLGLIGNNQYKELPRAVSKKKSYPLARDIIARTLGRMNPKVITELDEYLFSVTEKQLSELLDGYGYMLFYNGSLATAERLKLVEKIINYYPDNLLVVDRCIVCLSAFPMEETKEILIRLKEKYQEPVLLAEIEHSLKLIEISKIERKF